MIAVHTLVGIGLLSFSLILYGLLLPHGKRFRTRPRGKTPILLRVVGYVTVTLPVVAVLAGLNLTFNLHPFGIDYHRPWTYVYPLIPLLIVDSLFRGLIQGLSRPKGPYSAVSDDWLLWHKPSDETGSAEG